MPKGIKSTENYHNSRQLQLNSERWACVQLSLCILGAFKTRELALKLAKLCGVLEEKMKFGLEKLWYCFSLRIVKSDLTHLSRNSRVMCCQSNEKLFWNMNVPVFRVEWDS